ncbi:hypothetical protein Ccrd_024835 [Cynara cardunculus var. scolymus]|uniref:Uncharacterized protein n=1 Tax=Cynara cardunculus var. scolymus TaxID=59895 RepID=A0A103XBV2_CYNCS|nr:hypothetical protein Ccrd_024835 [Cynara cardunculus var. scolymus]
MRWILSLMTMISWTKMPLLTSTPLLRELPLQSLSLNRPSLVALSPLLLLFLGKLKDVDSVKKLMPNVIIVCLVILILSIQMASPVLNDKISFYFLMIVRGSLFVFIQEKVLLFSFKY